MAKRLSEIDQPKTKGRGGGKEETDLSHLRHDADSSALHGTPPELTGFSRASLPCH